MNRFPNLRLGQTNNNVVNNTANRAELTAAEAVELAEQRITFLEGELAKGGMTSNVRAGLMSELRSYKTFKATMAKGIAEGKVRPNEKMFNNKGRPTAKPGSWVAESLKSFKAAEGFTADGKPKAPKPKKGYSPQYHKAYKKKGVDVISGNAGVAYPGLPGYVFGEDRSTAVRMTPGNPYPGFFPDKNGNYNVFPSSGSTPVQIQAGFPTVEDSSKFYDAGANGVPVDSQGNILTYKPESSASGIQLAVGRKGVIHTANGKTATVSTGNNVAWLGPGNTHVYPVSNFKAASSKASKIVPVQKKAGVLVPGQSNQVFGENVQGNFVNVRAGVMVPGSGSHASAGGAARRLVYKSNVPTETHAWAVGGDAPFTSSGGVDTNPATRFNEAGGIATFSAGQNFPGASGKVFNTDYSQYAVGVGKEVPGSTGYDAKQAGNADGVGPGAQVYATNAKGQIVPVDKVRGNLIPSDDTRVYIETGAGAAVAQPNSGDAVIQAKGTSPSAIYYTGGGNSLTTMVKAGGRYVPTGPSLMFDSDKTNTIRNISTTTTVDKDSGVRYRMRVSPGQNVYGAEDPSYGKNFSTNSATQVIFDPSAHSTLSKGSAVNVYKKGGSAINAGQRPPVVLSIPMNPADLSKALQKNPFQAFSLDQISVAPLPDGAKTGVVNINSKSFTSWADAAESGILPGADPSIWVPGEAPGSPSKKAQFRVSALDVVNGGKDPSGGGAFVTANIGGLRGSRRMSPMHRQGGMGASVSTTTSTRASGGYRMADPRAENRW